MALTRTEDGYIQFMFQRKYYLKKRGRRKRKNTQNPFPLFCSSQLWLLPLCITLGREGGGEPSTLA